MNYRSDIDGLRAIAVLSVMIYHLNPHWIPGGFVGVDVFFVISGFVVCASLAQSRQERLGAFIAEFYARRLARIAPALLVVLLATALLATLFIPRAWLSSFSERTGLFAFFGLSNWVLQSNVDTYFAPRADFNPYTHTWSLGIEEQFYLLFPLVCYFWVRGIRAHDVSRERAARFVLAAACGASFLGSVWATGALPTAAFYSIAFRFWELAVGAMLFQQTCGATRGQVTPPGAAAVPATVRMALPWMGATGIAIAFAWSSPAHFPFPWALVVVASTALVIGGHTTNRAHVVRKVLGHRVLAWVGRLSYSLYLWHWPVYVLFRWTAGLDTAGTRLSALVITVSLAIASYHGIERPLRHNRSIERLASIVQVGLFAVAIATAWFIAQNLFQRQGSLGLSVVTRNANEWYVGHRMPDFLLPGRLCSTQVASAPFGSGSRLDYTPLACENRMGAPPSGSRLFVLGDSHATGYRPMMERWSADSGTPVTIFTSGGCAYLSLIKPMTEASSADCLPFWRAVEAELLRQAKPGDVLFLASLRQHRLADQGGSEATLQGGPPKLRQADVMLATREAEARIQPILARGMLVIFEAPKPIFGSPAFRCSDWFNAANPVCRSGLAQTRASLETARKPILAAMADLSRQSSVRVWDPFPTLCPFETECIALRDGRPNYFDGDHLTAFGNALLYPSFKAFMSRAMPPGAGG